MYMDKGQEWGGKNEEEREEGMGRRGQGRNGYYYIPTDEGTSLNLSLVIMSIGVNIQCRSLIFEGLGREGRLVKHTKGKGRGVRRGGRGKRGGNGIRGGRSRRWREGRRFFLS